MASPIFPSASFQQIHTPQRSEFRLGSLSNNIAAPAAHSHLLAVFEDLLSYPYRVVATGTHQHDIRDVYFPLALDNSTLLGQATRSHMAFDHVNFFDDYTPFVGMNAQDFTTLAAIFTSNDLNKIIPTNVRCMGDSLLHD
jgi:hypothetical protein